MFCLQFQQEHKLKGQLKNIAKTKTKDQLIAAYKALFEAKVDILSFLHFNFIMFNLT